MDTLADLALRLAEISDRDLQRLRATIEAAPNTVPGLLAWLEHAVDWESDNRAGRVYPLLGPMSAIPDDERTNSINAANLLAAKFRANNAEIAALFDLVGAILCTVTEKPGSLQ